MNQNIVDHVNGGGEKVTLEACFSLSEKTASKFAKPNCFGDVIYQEEERR